MTEVLIPVERLDEGFDKCMKQAEALLSASEILHSNSKYTTALALSILASEEVSKLRLIQQHIKAKKAIAKEEFDGLTIGRLGAHKKKLTKIHDDINRSMTTMKNDDFYDAGALLESLGFPQLEISFEAARKIHPTEKERLVVLDKLKQECLYVNWSKGNWSSFLFDATDDERKALSYAQYMRAKSDLNWSAWFRNIYKMHEHSPDALLDHDDPYLKKCLEIARIAQGQEFKQMKNIAMDVLDKYAKKFANS